MRIVDVVERSFPIASQIRNAYISFRHMTVSVVAVRTDVVRDGRPVVGFGFNSNGRYAQSGILHDRFLPRLKATDPARLVDEAAGNLDPFRIQAAILTDEKPGGHGDRAHAAAALDMAVWDAVAKIEGEPLWRVLSRRYNGGEADERVMVYPGGGYYYPGKDHAQLQDEMRGYLDGGYRAVKMKIGGAPLAEDLARIEAVLQVVGAGSSLAVDANGRFDLQTATRYGEAIAPYKLFWYEEPGDPLDYMLNAALAERYPGALATGENLFSLVDTRNLIRYGGMRPERDWIQVDPALAYGLTEYLRILDTLKTRGWSRRRMIPHGGHQLALHAAAGLQLGGSESYPGVFQPFGGFDDDLEIADGFARPSMRPGLGIEGKSQLWDLVRGLADG